MRGTSTGSSSRCGKNTGPREPARRQDAGVTRRHRAASGLLAARENIALAQRFTDAVKAAVRLLAGHPWIGKETDYAHPKVAGIRLFLVRNPFDKHLIFYRACGDTLDIVRIVHGLRDFPRRLLDPPWAE